MVDGYIIKEKDSYIVINYGCRFNSDTDIIKMYVDGGKVREYTIYASTNPELGFIYVGSDFSTILNEIRNGSVLHVRVDNDYDLKDFLFPLKGSRAAINKLNLK